MQRSGMSSAMTDIALRRLELQVFEVLGDARNLEDRLAKARAEAGKPPLPRLFYLADELPKPPEPPKEPAKPKYYWPKATPANAEGVSDVDEALPAAAYEAWASVIEASDGDAESRAFLRGVRSGYRLADPRWKAVREARRKRSHAASAWRKMLAEADQMVSRGDAALLLDPPAEPEPYKPTAAEILRAGQKRRGEVIDLPPEGSLAREVIRAAARARNQKDPTE